MGHLELEVAAEDLEQEEPHQAIGTTAAEEIMGCSCLNEDAVKVAL